MSIATLSDEALVGALRAPADEDASGPEQRYSALVEEFMGRHAAWLKGRCGQLARRYWRGDADFADEVFARFSEKLARHRLFSGLRASDKWRGFLAAELDHHAQDLGRFLRAARRDRRAEDGTTREVALDDSGTEPAAPETSAPFDVLVQRENVEAVHEAIRTLAKAAAARRPQDSSRDIHNLQMFVRVILQGRSRKDVALEELSVATRSTNRSAITLEGARKKVERAVIGGVVAVADALAGMGHGDLARSFRQYLQNQSTVRGRGARIPTTHAAVPDKP